MKHAYVNGNIFTSCQNTPFVDAFIEENGMITGFGSSQSVLSESPDEITDLQGTCVIPGLIDSHLHPITLAIYSDLISALPPKVCSIEELKKEVAARASSSRQGEWIRGWGFDEGKFAEHRRPDKRDLDQMAPDNPVMIVRTCGHIYSVNSKALEIAGIDRETPDPEGGFIEKDEKGEPTGILRESACRLIDAHIPPVEFDGLVDSLVNLSGVLASQGIVAVSDMCDVSILEDYDFYRVAGEKGFAQDVNIYLYYEHMDNYKEYCITPEMRDENAQFRVAGLKLIADGSVSGHTAWVDKPYLGTEECGMQVCSDQDLEEAIYICENQHCQFSAHVMGERAISHVLDFVCSKHRWMENPAIPHVRLEHVTEPSEYSLNRIAEHQIAISTQPMFFYSEIESYLKNLGEARTASTYPIRTELDRGIKVALSTDAPSNAWAMPSDPFVNIEAAITRKAYDGTDCNEKEAIDIETAIRMYTKEAAMISGRTKQGCIAPGYEASFILLDQNIFTVEKDQIHTVKPVATYIRGKKIMELT